MALVCGLAAPGGAQECAPWPGEPARLSAHPGELPAVARWRELRTAELSARARRLEVRAPVEAHLLWRRVLCFDAWNEEARRGSERTRPLRIQRPALGVVGAEEGGPRPAPRTVAVVAPEAAREVPPAGPPEPAARVRRLAIIEGLLASADALAREARFEEALATLSHARRSLDGMGAGEALRAPRARLELLAATAQLGLGREAEARRHLEAALAADPEIAPDGASRSPELVRALRDARAPRR